jgi:hypothetical protein
MAKQGYVAGFCSLHLFLHFSAATNLEGDIDDLRKSCALWPSFSLVFLRDVYCRIFCKINSLSIFLVRILTMSPLELTAFAFPGSPSYFHIPMSLLAMCQSTPHVLIVLLKLQYITPLPPLAFPSSLFHASPRQLHRHPSHLLLSPEPPHILRAKLLNLIIQMLPQHLSKTLHNPLQLAHPQFPLPFPTS